MAPRFHEASGSIDCGLRRSGIVSTPILSARPRLTASSHTIALEQLLPVLLSMPESDKPPQMPFTFTGGFALPTKTVGLILSLQGVLQIIAQLGLFPIISARLGALKT